MDKKIRAISVALNRLVLRTDLNPDYLIFSRFYLKNRTTTKPTPKSLFFNDFNARRGIATPDFNSMVSEGNYPFRVHKGEQRNRATSSRPTMPYLRSNGLTLYQTNYSITHEHLFVKCFLILFRISHNARSLIFCVSFPIFPPDFRIRAVRI